MTLEMLQLASESYGPDAGKHPYEPLRSQSNSSADLSENVSAQAQGRNWHVVSAMELGINPADFGGLGNYQYSFVGGHWQAIDTSDVYPSNHDMPEANALVLTGIVNGQKTLAIAFRGSDQTSDLNDYPDFFRHWAKYLPLI